VCVVCCIVSLTAISSVVQPHRVTAVLLGCAVLRNELQDTACISFNLAIAQDARFVAAKSVSTKSSFRDSSAK
jgi:hypothetical protein